MCLAAFKLPGAKIPVEHIREAMLHNADGAGIAYAKDGRVCVIKGLWTPDSVVRAMRRLDRYPVAFHARLATHGKVSRENCHPFRVADDCAIIHNGIIPGYGSKKLSDTLDFTTRELIPCYEAGILRDRDIRQAYEDVIGDGNKMVILHGDETCHILNEDQGHWLDDVWYSNHSYLPWLQRPYAQSSWDWRDFDDDYDYANELNSGRWEQTSLGKYHYVPGAKDRR